MGPYLTNIQTLSSAKASDLLFLMNTASVVGYFVSGYLADKFGLLRTVIVSSSLFFLSQLLIAISPQQVPMIYLGLLLFTFGFGGSFNAMLFSHVRNLFPSYLSGRALSLVNMFGIGAVYVMQWLLGLIINAFPKIQGMYDPVAFRWAFLLTAGLGLLSLLVYASFLFQNRATSRTD
jgi:MFS family permease